MHTDLYERFDDLLNDLSTHSDILLTADKLERGSQDVDAIAARAGLTQGLRAPRGASLR